MARIGENIPTDNEDPCWSGGRDRRTENGNGTTANIVAAFIHQTSWVFAPLKPFYDSIKFSSPVVRSSFTFAENLVNQIIELLSKADKDSRIKDDNERVAEQETAAYDSLSSYATTVIKHIYKFWYKAHQNLVVLVDYIALLFEEIVPLTPGDKPWISLEKKNVSIRELCLHAMISMMRRLFYHSRKFLQEKITFDEDIRTSK